MRGIIVAQKGAREHYLAARALHARDALSALLTDVQPPSPATGLAHCLNRWGGAWGRRFLTRRVPGIPTIKVRAAGWRALGWMARERLAVRQGRPYAGYRASDAAFARWVAGLSLPPHEVFFGYSYASLEAMQVERRRGALIVLDQIDAGPRHDRIRREESRKWPRYAVAVDADTDAYYNRARREWALADLIIVNSEWTRDALREEGVADDRICIIPLAYEPERNVPPARRPPPPPPLRVLWLGAVTLTKGIQYLVEAAERLTDQAVSFTVAGAIGVRREALRSAPSNIRWLGPVPRSATAALYREHHVFVLPTVSDGFAITQLEAMAHGLPVIITPNCGRVVEDGETGFVIPPFSTDALVEAIRRFVRSPELVNQMAEKCPSVAAGYSIENYGNQLIEAVVDRKRDQSGARGNAETLKC